MSAICGLIGSFAAVSSAEHDVSLLVDGLAKRAAGAAARFAAPEAILASRAGPAGGGVVRRSADARYSAVCDGEVFNKPQIFEYLQSRGVTPASGDATELLLQCFILEGADALRRVDGQFALAVWDSQRRTLHIARDFLGVIPAYYFASPKGAAFASEIKALIRHPAVGRSYDLASVSNYLTFLTVPGPSTLFKGVRKVPAGHMVEISSSGAVTLRRFWDLLQEPIDERDDANFYVSRVRELHQRAVSNRMVDGPVGAMCSGGNDSSANVSLMSRLAGGGSRIHTFTVGLAEFEGDPAYTDLLYARKVAEQAGTQHHEHLMTTDEFLAEIPAVTGDLDDLVSEPSSIFLRCALRLAKDSGVTTVLTGEANDELCCGHGEMIDIRKGYYDRWQPYMRKPALLRRLAAIAAPLLSPSRKDILTRAARGEEYFWSFEIGWPQTAKSEILSAQAMSALRGTSSWEVVQRCLDQFGKSAHAKRDYLNYIVYNMMQDFYFGNLMLGKLDLLARGLGLDARCPYTEPTYAHWVYNIPAQFKLRDGTVKWFFKKAIEGVLADDIIYRPKQGFRTPVVELFKGRLGDWARPILMEGGFTAEGILNKTHLQRMLDMHRSGVADFSNRLWTVMALNLWYERWIRG